MFDLNIFDRFKNVIITPRLIPAPKAAFGTKTKTNEKIGIEVELEKTQLKQNLNTVPYWTMTTDGSLKIQGQEFIICCYSNKTKQAIKILQESLHRSDSSQRTSVHIHINVDNLTPIQLILFTYIYMLFEIPLIKYSGGRFNNFFCVPVNEWWSGDPQYLLNWPKYSAINLLPKLHRDNGLHLSTIEFRQMKGNLNEDYIQNWVDLIVKLKQYTLSTNIEDFLKLLITANTTSSYNPLLKEIFKDKADLLYYPEINKNIEESISKLKFKLFKFNIFKNIESSWSLKENEIFAQINTEYFLALNYKKDLSQENSFDNPEKETPEEVRQFFEEPPTHTPTPFNVHNQIQTIGQREAFMRTPLTFDNPDILINPEGTNILPEIQRRNPPPIRPTPRALTPPTTTRTLL